MRKLIILGILSIFVLSSIGLVSAGNKALLIGINDYSNYGEFKNLSYCTDDVDDISATLSNEWPTSNIEEYEVSILKDKQATAANIRNKITNWIGNSVGKDETVIIYIAGHGNNRSWNGTAWVPGKYYTVAFDQYIANDTFNSWVDSIASQNIIVILDHCHSEGIAINKPGRTFLTACKSNEYAIEEDRWIWKGNGRFTYYVAEGLSDWVHRAWWFCSTGAADESGYGGNENYEVTVAELYNYVSTHAKLSDMTPQHIGDLNNVVITRFKPKIETTNSSGVKKDTFVKGVDDESVHVVGAGFPKNGYYPLYVVNDTTWTDGMPIPDGADRVLTRHVTTNESGWVIPVPLFIWHFSQTKMGEYDIIVDVNENKKYDARVDALDDMDVKGAGFEVVPEFATIAIPVAAILGLVFLMSRRSRHSRRKN